MESVRKKEGISAAIDRVSTGMHANVRGCVQRAYGQDQSYRVRGNVCQLNETVGTGDEIRAEVAVKRTGHDFVVLRGLEALLCHVAIDGVLR